MNKKMQYEEILKSLSLRKSTRRFLPEKLPDNIVDKIILDGIEAPTSCNHQLHHFVVVKDDQTKNLLQKISGSNDHFLQASHLLVICFQKGWNHNKYAVIQSTAAITYHMLLSANLRGIGSVWNAGVGNTSKISMLLKIPKSFEILGIVCLGYSDKSIHNSKPPRRDLNIIRSYDGFFRDPSHIFPLHNKSYEYHKIKNHRNNVSIHNPEKWTQDQIMNWRSFSVFAKSPTPGIYVSRRLGKEMPHEVNYIKSVEHDSKILELFPFGGSYTVKLISEIRKKKNIDFTICDLSESNIKFTLERVLNETEKNNDISFFTGKYDALPFKDNSFDYVFLPQILETVPDQDKLLKEVHRILKTNGMLIASVRNLFSWFGFYYFKNIKKSQVTNFGPYFPLKIPFFKKKIEGLFFKNDEYGISPSINKIGIIKRNFFKYFSRLWVFIGTKK